MKDVRIRLTYEIQEVRDNLWKELISRKKNLYNTRFNNPITITNFRELNLWI